jgi:hypothetical protein
VGVDELEVDRVGGRREAEVDRVGGRREAEKQ